MDGNGQIQQFDTMLQRMYHDVLWLTWIFRCQARLEGMAIPGQIKNS